MATFTASAAQSNVPAIMSVNRTITRTVKYTHALALSAGDVFQMVKVPNGCNITRVAAAASMSAGVATVNIGDGGDTSRIAASAVLSAAQVFTAMTFRGAGYSYSVEDTIDIQIAVLSAVPGTCKLVLTVDYNMQSGQ